MRQIEEIFVHCSDSDWGCASVIDSWHRARGWDGIGYTAVICNGKPNASMQHDADWDGLIEAGRDPSRIGAHVRGRNAHSLGVCLIGRDRFTVRQKSALLYLLADWCIRYRVPVSSVRGHGEVDRDKTCPNFNMSQVRHELANHIGVIRRGLGEKG